MFLKRRDVFSCLATLFLVPAAWALPTSHHTVTSAALTAQAAAPSQSVSGKIAAVDKTSFTLTVGAGSTNRELQQQEADLQVQIGEAEQPGQRMYNGHGRPTKYRYDNPKAPQLTMLRSRLHDVQQAKDTIRRELEKAQH